MTPVEATSKPRAGHDESDESRMAQARPGEREQVVATPEAVQDVAGPDNGAEDESDEWRDRALRLQAEMANYRKRQQRLAEGQIDTERQRLLGAFLRIVDDLERALATPVGGDGGLRQGIHLTHRAALQLLQKEGVEQVDAANQPFDPTWHEAVATVARNGANVAPDTIVQVLEPGYRLDDQLLRPAKVIVAI